MEKPALTAAPLTDLIQRRWSPRAFSGDVIADEQLVKLFEAARWASSRNNLQPWRFIVANRSDEAAFATMLNCLLPGNQKWAHAAGALVAVVVNLTPKPDADPNMALMYDAGLAVSQLVTEAMANDLYVHQMAGIDRPKIVATYGVPDKHAVACVLAIGTQGDKSTLPEPFDAREVAPRSRKPLGEIVFSGSWGNTVFD